MIIDAHVHAAREFANTDRLIEKIDKLGIDKIVLCPSLKNNIALQDAPKIPVLAKNADKMFFLNKICRLSYQYLIKDMGDGNKFVYSMAKKHPERIIQFYWVNPIEPDFLEKLNRAIKEQSIRGIKLHQACNSFTIMSREIQEISKIAGIRQFPIFIHLFSKSDVTQLIELALLYPKTTFIVAHLLGMEIIAKYEKVIPNIYLEISGDIDIVTQERIEYAVQKFGTEHIIYGSDGPFISMELSLERMNEVHITESQKEYILRKKIERLILQK
jgi:predicted TIM-barrel fold metal-dependent hydrolase